MLLPTVLTIISLASPFSAGMEPSRMEEETVLDTLQGAVHVSSAKQVLPVEDIPSAVSVMEAGEIENRGVGSIKDFTDIMPNLYIPDYGSAMTSSVYLRGFGSRMDNPVMGLYVDDVPIMNKNAYDFDFYDIAEAVLLRGPQSTLYGRNSTSGVLLLNTLSVRDFTGIRASAEYGSANTFKLKCAAYLPGEVAFSVGYRHSDGFYHNDYDGRSADRYDAFNFGFKVHRKLRRDLFFENILSLSMLAQDGYPYREYDSSAGILHPVSYNDTSAYGRIYLNEAFKFKYMASGFSLSSVTSFQILYDEMRLDQDFTDASLFTLRQTQAEAAATCELILKPEPDWRKPWWNWQTGFFAFFKYNDMSAPVKFKRDGIDDIILANANEGMQAGLDGAELFIEEDEFDIFSDFGIMTGGAALYHESYFTAGNWLFTAGLRFDYEGARMDYDSRSALHYRLEAPGLTPDAGYRPYECIYKGNQAIGWFEFMPKLSVMYDFGAVKAYATVSEGYKAGGFNVQIFSDILQNKMMEGIMEGLGVYFESPVGNIGAENTSYMPERCVNFEAGGRFDVQRNGYGISGELSLFHAQCHNQQLTVFPPGKSTGRMMTNAGKSASSGAEASIFSRLENFSLSVSYGYCHAEFVEYNDGANDFRGNRIPYSPEHTVNARLSYEWKANRGFFKSLTAFADYSGVGKIYWNEANTLYEPFHSFLGAGIRAEFSRFGIFIRGENLTDTRNRTFYFKSVGREFFQVGKPVRFTVGITL